MKIKFLLQSCPLLIICGLVGINKLHAQAAFATAPDKPISVNVYALLNTSVVYSNNNPTATESAATSSWQEHTASVAVPLLA